MRCLACGAEMHLMQAVPDDTMMVAGYEHQTWQCTSCNDVERRLAFSRAKTPIAAVPMPAAPPQDDSPPTPAPEPPLAAATTASASAWARTIARIRGRHID